MDNFNKVISFVLGLVVVVVLLVILTGRFNLRQKFLPLANNTKTTPTLTPKTQKPGANPSNMPTGQTGTQTYEYHSYSGGYGQGGQSSGGQMAGQTKGGTIASIPNTGAPTLLLPFAFSSLAGGVFLRRKK